MSVTMKELKVIDQGEIVKLLQESRSELRHLKVKAGAQDLKNVRSIRSLKRQVARLNTRLSELKTVQSK